MKKKPKTIVKKNAEPQVPSLEPRVTSPESRVPSNFDELRVKAEAKLKNKIAAMRKQSQGNLDKVLHELSVHQIELEMQNEELRSAQQELEKSRNKYSDLYDFAPVGYFSFDKKGLVIEANLTGCVMLGIERKLIIKKPFHIFVDRESQDTFYKHRNTALTPGFKQSCEITLVRKNKEKFYALLESVPVADADGNITSCRTIVTDISERKLAKEQLEMLNENLVTSNEGLQAAQDTMRDNEQQIEADNKQLSALNEKLLDSNDELRETQEYLRENQERLQTLNEQLTTAMEELRKNEALLRAVLDGTSDPVYVKDRQSRILIGNPALAKVVGKPLAQIIGKTDSEYYGDDNTGKLLRDNDLKVMTSGHTELMEETVPSANGLRTFISNKAPLKNADGEIIGIVGISHDITERKKAEKKILQQASVFYGINKIFEAVIGTATEEQLGEVCLSVAEEVTQSKFGFIGKINEKGLQDIAISNPGWDACKIMDIGGHRTPPGSFKIHGVYGSVVKNRKGFFTNDPSSHPDSIGLPKGHPPLESFLGVPLIDHGKVIGMIAVGNRENGFSADELESLEILAPAIVEAFYRKHAEDALRESEQRLRLAQQAARIGTFEWNIQTGVNTWTPELEAMYGLETGSFAHTQPAWENLVHPDDRAEAARRVEQAFKTGDPMEGEWRVVWPDGSIRWIFGRWQVFKDTVGKPLCMTGVNIDITERKLVEDVQSFLLKCGWPGSDENFFRALARYLAEKLAADFICIDALQEDGLLAQTVAVYSDGRFEDNVKYALKDTPCGDVVGKTICCFPKDVCALFPHDEVLRQIAAESYVGTTLWNSQGQPIGLIAIIWKRPLPDTRMAESILKLVAVRAAGELERNKNEEQLRQIREELERSNEDLQQFAYMASHDLREPLRAIDGFLGLLEKKYKNELDEKANEYIHYAVGGARRMDNLLVGLLEYSRVQTHGQIPKPIDSQKCLNSAVANLKVSIDESDAAITSDQLPSLKADAAQLILLFQNLLHNAIKFKSDQKPQIHISCQKQDDSFLFSVRDNGIGIEPQFRERLFTLFHRAYPQDKRSGMGVGLAVCKKIVERHGGKIWFESEPAKGSTFFFTLPT